MASDVLLAKAATIERTLQRIAQEYEGHEADLEREYTRQDSILLNLQRCCQASIDGAMHMVRVHGLGLPRESREAFTLLEEANLLSPDLAERLRLRSRACGCASPRPRGACGPTRRRGRPPFHRSSASGATSARGETLSEHNANPITTGQVVYIAGPHRADNACLREQNIRRAEEASFRVAQSGDIPLCPHSATRFFDGTLNDAYWLAATLKLLRRCDAILMVAGWQNSEGSLGELAEAERLGIPVRYDEGARPGEGSR